MKRLLTLTLALVLAFSLATPILSLASEPATGGATVYPDLTESEYNSLYVSDGLIFMLDFYRTNSYWRTAGESYAVPIGPSENTAYHHDLDGDGVVDDGESIVNLTRDSNRGAYRVLIKRGTTYTYYDPDVTPVYNGTSTPGVEYATEAAANIASDAARTAISDAIDAYNARPENANRKLNKSDYEVVVGLSASNALIAANKAWGAADRAFLASFVSVNTEGLALSSYNPAINLGRTDFSSNSKLLYSAYRLGDGYIEMRTDYHSSGGLVMSDLRKGVKEDSSWQIVTRLGEKATSAFVLYAGTRLSTTYNSYTNTISPVSFTAQSTFQLNAGTTMPKVGSIDCGSVQDLTYTIRGNVVAGETVPATFSLRTLTSTVLEASGTYKLDATTYFGWGQSARSARIYAMRNYIAPLSNADLLQNHFADLAKFFRLDVTSLMSGEVGSRTVSVTPYVLSAVAARMSDYTLEDDRDAVVAALAEAIAAVTFSGEGDAFTLFADDVASGVIDATTVYALPREHHSTVYTAYKAFLDHTPSATDTEKQAAVESAVVAILSDPTLPYAAYYEKPIEVTTATHFSAKPAESENALHFERLATAVGLDMKPIVDLSPVILEYVYAEFAAYPFVVFQHAAVLQAKLASAAAALEEFYFGDGIVGDLVEFEGYQFRLVGATAYRAVFSVDTEVLAILEEHNYTVSVGITYKVRNAAGDPTVIEIYESGSTDAAPFFTMDGKACMTHEVYTDKPLEIGEYKAYATIAREGNETLTVYFDAVSSLLPQGAQLKDLAEILSDRGVVSTNIQRFLKYRNEVMPTIFIGGVNLSEFRAVSDGASAAVSSLYLDALKEVTRIEYATVTAAEAEGMSAGLVLFEKGNAPAIRLEGGNVIFTYTDDLNATKAAFAAALAKPEGGYKTFAFEGEEPAPVCLLSEYHPLTVEE